MYFGHAKINGNFTKWSLSIYTEKTMTAILTVASKNMCCVDVKNRHVQDTYFQLTETMIMCLINQQIILR